MGPNIENIFLIKDGQIEAEGSFDQIKETDAYQEYMTDKIKQLEDKQKAMEEKDENALDSEIQLIKQLSEEKMVLQKIKSTHSKHSKNSYLDELDIADEHLGQKVVEVLD